jgi:hypothetical protein
MKCESIGSIDNAGSQVCIRAKHALGSGGSGNELNPGRFRSASEAAQVCEDLVDMINTYYEMNE